MIKISKIIVFVFLIAGAGEIAAQTKNPQTVFNLDDKVQKEVAVPEAVIAVLKSDRIVDGCFKTKGAVKEAELFAASEIDLNGDNRNDLIIKAKDACLYGANQAPFWIFQNAADGYQKILSASGLQLVVLPKKSNSFNQIKISKVVAMKPSSQTYKFRAGKYQAGK
jgi:hypothetical protein